MGLKRITYSLPILKSLVNSKTSCVLCFESCRRCFHTTPAQLANLKVVLKEHLATKVSSYDPELRGIIMSYKNIKVLNSIPLSDDGEYRLEFIADIYVFKPTVGNILIGTVNKKSQDHLGVLVHSFFNATIHRQRVDAECPKTWAGADVKIGEQVTFEVVKVNFLSKLPYIKGQLIEVKKNHAEDVDSGFSGYENNEECSSRSTADSDCSEERDRSKGKDLKLPRNSKKKRSILDLQSSLISEVMAGPTHSPIPPKVSHPNSFLYSSPKNVSKSKKRKRDSSLSEIENSLVTEAIERLTSPEVLNFSQPKKKKKRKSDSIIFSDANGTLLESESLGTAENTIQNLINSEISSLKPKKKKSSLFLSENDPSLSTSVESHINATDESLRRKKGKKSSSKEKNDFLEENTSLNEGMYILQQGFGSSSDVSNKKNKVSDLEALGEVENIKLIKKKRKKEKILDY